MTAEVSHVRNSKVAAETAIAVFLFVSQAGRRMALMFKANIGIKTKA